jgi:transposase
MYEGFTEAVREVIGEAVIVIDRFHVAKLYGKCADDLRTREMRRLKKEMSEKEYEQIKGVMWAFRKNEEDLEEEEKRKLEKLLSHSPELEKAYRLREALRAIFEKKMSNSCFTNLIGVSRSNSGFLVFANTKNRTPKSERRSSLSYCGCYL